MYYVELLGGAILGAGIFLFAGIFWRLFKLEDIVDPLGVVFERNWRLKPRPLLRLTVLIAACYVLLLFRNVWEGWWPF